MQFAGIAAQSITERFLGFRLKTLLEMTEVISVVFVTVWFIEKELLLAGSDDFGPFGFRVNMVHPPQHAFQLVIGILLDLLSQTSVRKTTLTRNPSPNSLVDYLKG